MAAALGFAAHRSFLTYVATVVEVEVNDHGEVRIARVDTVLDAGLVVNPEATRASLRARRCSAQVFSGLSGSSLERRPIRGPVLIWNGKLKVREKP